MLQAPAQELGVAQRYQKPGPREFFGRADERGEIIVGFRDRVREMADASCVAADASLTLGVLKNSVLERAGLSSYCCLLEPWLLRLMCCREKRVRRGRLTIRPVSTVIHQKRCVTVGAPALEWSGSPSRRPVGP